jgi:hypothetical protein
VTAVLALTFIAQVLIALGLTAVLAARLLMPGSPCRPVARWWRGRIVAVMAPAPGWPQRGALA